MLTADDPQPAWTQALLGDARLRLGDPAAARAAFEAALAAGSSSCPDPAAVHLALADLDLADGDFPGAKERLEEAVEGPDGRSAAVQTALADLRLADGRSGEALDLIRAAVAGLDLDALAASCPNRAGPAAARDETRRLLERALEVAAAATAGERSVADLALMLEIAERTLALDGQPVREAMVAALAAGEGPAAALLGERRRLDRAIAGRRSLLVRHRLAPVIAAGQRGAVQDEVLRLERQRDDVRQSFRLEAGPSLVLADPPSVSLADLQSRLGENEAVLVQITTGRLTHLFLIRRGSVAFAQTEVTVPDLAAWVVAARREIVGDDAFDSFPLYALHAGLIAPFAASLADVDHLLVLPDRAMRDLPFGVLVEGPAEPVPAGGGHGAIDFLIERLAISVVPNLRSVGRRSAPSSADLPLLGLAAPLSRDEPVPDEEREEWLRALAETVAGGSDDVVLDLQARTTTLSALDLARFQVVALAMPLPAPPGGPSAPLAGDGEEVITAGDIARLDLDADMVVLRPEGDGAGGSLIAPAFLVAGAMSVAVGHWPAPPEAASMVGRAAGLLEQQPDLAPAEALRRAILPMIAGERGPDAVRPEVWGAFSIVSGGG